MNTHPFEVIKYAPPRACRRDIVSAHGSPLCLPGFLMSRGLPREDLRAGQVPRAVRPAGGAVRVTGTQPGCGLAAVPQVRWPPRCLEVGPVQHPGHASENDFPGGLEKLVLEEGSRFKDPGLTSPERPWVCAPLPGAAVHGGAGRLGCPWGRGRGSPGRECLNRPGQHCGPVGHLTPAPAER